MTAISIIVPIYNMEKYLEQCLNSISNQTLREIEIVCVNDGSKDQSLHILEEFHKKDERLVIVNQENQGVSCARNAGISRATGEFVCFMDPDDWYLEPTTLESLYATAKKNGVLICGGSFCRYDSRKNCYITKFDGYYSQYTFKKEGIIPYSEYQYDYGYHRFIYNLDFLKKHEIYFPPYIRFQDPPFFVKAMIFAKQFYAVPMITYCYRVGHQTVRWDEERFSALLNGINDNLKFSKDNVLPDLHNITIHRLAEHEKKVTHSIPQLSSKSLEILMDILLNIDLALLQKSKYSTNDVVSVKRLFKNYSSTGESNWKRQYDCIVNSRSFRLGRMITYLPRKFRDCIKIS